MIISNKRINKGADKAARKLRPVCAFVVRKPLKTGLLAHISMSISIPMSIRIYVAFMWYLINIFLNTSCSRYLNALETRNPKTCILSNSENPGKMQHHDHSVH